MNKWGVVVLAGVLGLSVTARARAQGAEGGRPVTGDGLTLVGAMRVAVAQNPALAASFVDVSVADARVLEARGLDDFVVDASATWSRSRTDNVTGASVLSPYDRVGVAASLTRPFSTGGSVALKLDAPYVRRGVSSDADPMRIVPADVYTPSVQLGLTQPLLRGRGYDVARAKARQANADRGITTRKLVAGASALLRDVAHAYWELRYATGALALRREARDATREQLRAVMAQIDVGKQSPSGSAEVEVSVALREEEAIDAERVLAQRSAELARLLGYPTERPLVYPSDEPTVLASLRGDVLARALAQNAEVLALEAQARAATIDIDVAESALLPMLDVYASGGALGVGNDPSKALSNLGNFGGYTVQAGIVFQEPVERRGQRGARDAAMERAHKAHLLAEEARTRVANDVTNALAALDATHRRTEVLARAASAADLDLAGEKARFQANRSTNFDVLRRQQAVTDVRLRLLRAAIDNAKAMATVDALTADILPRHGIALRTASRSTP
ncbi:TolC family protein [Pendulispora albinea]|uniref:TolC family protein n=1 Tax=Pendulispora albinea TaxID=2741071 RepID=A0ABZ2LTU3_9BACT